MNLLFLSRKLHPWFPLTAVLLSGCTVGPDYRQAPPVAVPTEYKEARNWKPAQPDDAAMRGKWWETFHDSRLNELEEQVNISNQNVAEAEALFREAVAAVDVARSGLFPTITANPSYTEAQSSQSLTSRSQNGPHVGAVTIGTYNLPVEGSYFVDVWGAVRRNVEAAENSAQASFADLENARLSYQATLAEYYFNLRGIDAQAELLESTLAAYRKSLDLTTNRYNAGIASKADVAQAKTQLSTTDVQLTDLGVARAQYEHGIATLIGRPASLFTLGRLPLKATPPPVPTDLPSTLLQRRPDIAGAERRVASANATVGVAISAYYPSITLNASTGLEAIKLSELFSGPSFLWSVGPAVAQTIFNGGKFQAQEAQARANYDATVATYRQTVLTAFQQVEDDLAGLRILDQEAGEQDQAVKSAQDSLAISTNLYKAGTQDYLNVITAQTTALANEINAVDIQTRRMTTCVLLIEALGGGWNATTIPQARKITGSN